VEAEAWGAASVLLNHPAAILNPGRATFQAAVTVIDLTAEFNGSGTTALGAPAGPLTGGDGGDPGDPTPVPAMAFVFPLSGALDSVTLGASVTAPCGLKTEYDAARAGRYDGVTARVRIVA